MFKTMKGRSNSATIVGFCFIIKLNFYCFPLYEATGSVPFSARAILPGLRQYAVI